MSILRIANHYIQHPTPFLSVLNPPLPIDPSACSWFIQLYRYYINKKNSLRNTIIFFFKQQSKKKVTNLSTKSRVSWLLLLPRSHVNSVYTLLADRNIPFTPQNIKKLNVKLIAIPDFHNLLLQDLKQSFFMDQRLIYIHYLLGRFRVRQYKTMERREIVSPVHACDTNLLFFLF